MYRIEREFHPGTDNSHWGVLVESYYPNCWEGLDTTRPRLFATRGGARNHIKNMDITRARIVKHETRANDDAGNKAE